MRIKTLSSTQPSWVNLWPHTGFLKKTTLSRRYRDAIKTISNRPKAGVSERNRRVDFDGEAELPHIQLAGWVAKIKIGVDKMETINLKPARYAKEPEVILLQDGTIYTIPPETRVLRLENSDRWLNLLTIPGGEKFALWGNGGPAALTQMSFVEASGRFLQGLGPK